jgi:hypothetical protein
MTSMNFANANVVVGTSSATIPSSLSHSGPVNVSFPAGVFTSVPILDLTVQTVTTDDNPVWVNVLRTASHPNNSGVDVNGFSFSIHSQNQVGSSTTLTVWYIAIQPS